MKRKKIQHSYLNEKSKISEHSLYMVFSGVSKDGGDITDCMSKAISGVLGENI